MIVSYYTPQYKPVFNEFLKPSLEKFKIDYDVEEIESLGSWKKNTDYKPKFLLDKLKKYGIIQYLDVDAEIKKYPKLLFTVDKLALHELNWNIHYGRTQMSPTLELLSGTMVLTANDILLVEEWIKLAPSFNWEQKAMEHIIRRDKIDFYKLPSEYCAIIDKQGNIPSYYEEVVILHNQKSRDLKRKIT